MKPTLIHGYGLLQWPRAWYELPFDCYQLLTSTNMKCVLIVIIICLGMNVLTLPKFCIRFVITHKSTYKCPIANRILLYKLLVECFNWYHQFFIYIIYIIWYYQFLHYNITLHYFNVTIEFISSLGIYFECLI